MAAIIFTITAAGLNAALDAANTGFSLEMTELSGHDESGAEIGRWTLGGGIVQPTSNVLHFNALLKSPTQKNIYGLKLLAGSVVFATAVGVDPLVVVDANIDFGAAFAIALAQIPSGAVSVTTDINSPIAQILMTQHLGAVNPHPQYTLLTNFINTIESIQRRLSIVEMAFIVNFINQQMLPILQGLVSYEGQIEHVGVAMTAAQFAAVKADGSVWDVYAPGRVIVGAGSATIDYADAVGDAARPDIIRSFAVGDTGGEFDHLQTTGELHNHKHSVGDVYNKFSAIVDDVFAVGDATDAGGLGFGLSVASADNASGATEIQVADISPDQILKMTEQSVGSSTPFNVMQPYIVAHSFICVTAASPIHQLAFPA